MIEYPHTGPFHFHLSIADITIELHTNRTELHHLLRKRYHEFIAPAIHPHMVCNLEWAPANDLPVSSDLSVSFTPGGLRFESPAASGWIDLSTGEAQLTCVTSKVEGALEYFLRFVFALLVFEAGGLMLHGAGVVRAGQAAVFFGHSGSGKSTVSRLSGEDNVLNDDLLLLVPDGDTWLVAATPFWNPTQVRPSIRQARLGGLFRLVQDTVVFLQPANPAVALAELVSAVPILNADSRRMPLILDRLNLLNADCPVQFLHFLPDVSFWRVVEPSLNRGG